MSTRVMLLEVLSCPNAIGEKVSRLLVKMKIRLRASEKLLAEGNK